MDKKLLTLVFLSIIAAGCLNGNSSGEVGDYGVEVAEFSTTDSQIVPGQNSQIILRLENYQEQNIDIENISLYNTHFLDVADNGCTPEGELSAAEQGSPSQMECRWTVSTEEEHIEGYNSRNVPVQLDLRYDSVLETSEPLQVQYMPFEEIEQTEQRSTTFSNNEIDFTIDLRQPVSEEGTPAYISISDTGEGQVESNYDISADQESFSDCEGEQDHYLGDDIEFDCNVEPERTEERVENTFFSVSYKYSQSPSLNIEVVNR